MVEALLIPKLQVLGLAPAVRRHLNILRLEGICLDVGHSSELQPGAAVPQVPAPRPEELYVDGKPGGKCRSRRDSIC